MTATLYERLGGTERIRGLAARAVELHMSNPSLAAHRKQMKSHVELEGDLFDFFCAGRGGPKSYTCHDVLSGHRAMAFDEQELGAAMDDLVAAMTRSGYGLAEKNDALAIL